MTSLVASPDVSGPPAAGDRLAFNATAYAKGLRRRLASPSRPASRRPILSCCRSVLSLRWAPQPKYSGIYTVMDTGPAIKGG